MATFVHTRALRQGRVVPSAAMKAAMEAGVVADLTWDGVLAE